MSWLRILCAIQVYGIHYFCGHGLRVHIWLFTLAVPTFLLMSAYLYGIRYNKETRLGTGFLWKRFVSISCMTYPLLAIVFVCSVIKQSENITQYAISLLAELTYLHDFIGPHLPEMGHLWYLQSLLLCYIALTICTRVRFIRRLFTTPWTIIMLFAVVLGFGLIYRGSILPYIYFYLLVFYNAKLIKKLYSNRKVTIVVSILLLLIHFAVVSTNYLNSFHYAIYLWFVQSLLFSILLIGIFQNISCILPKTRMVSYCASLTMAFYLVQQFFAFHWGFCLGFIMTIICSIGLDYLGRKIKKCVLQLYEKN